MLPITKAVMLHVAPKFIRNVKRHKSQTAIVDEVSKTINSVTQSYNISTLLRRAHFLAQICTESDGFSAMEEYDSGTKYEGRVKNLGNDHLGDGPRYRGRGLIMLTGRDNYQHIGKALGLPLEAQPELASDLSVVVKIACEYWKYRHINHACDADDIIRVTRLVNGDLMGLHQRETYLARATAALQGEAPAPVLRFHSGLVPASIPA